MIHKIHRKTPELESLFKKSLEVALFTDVLQNSCSLKFRKFHKKTSVLESFLTKLQALRTATLLTRDFNTVFL